MNDKNEPKTDTTESEVQTAMHDLEASCRCLQALSVELEKLLCPVLSTDCAACESKPESDSYGVPLVNDIYAQVRSLKATALDLTSLCGRISV